MVRNHDPRGGFGLNRKGNVSTRFIRRVCVGLNVLVGVDPSFWERCVSSPGPPEPLPHHTSLCLPYRVFPSGPSSPRVVPVPTYCTVCPKLHTDVTLPLDPGRRLRCGTVVPLSRRPPCARVPLSGTCRRVALPDPTTPTTDWDVPGLTVRSVPPEVATGGQGSSVHPPPPHPRI